MGIDLHSIGVLYALGAAAVWAASTVAGKVLVSKIPTSVANFWRFTFGLLGISILMLLTRDPQPWHLLTTSVSALPLIYLSLVPGILAMGIYYLGLTKTSASITSLVELIYPIGAVI